MWIVCVVILGVSLVSATCPKDCRCPPEVTTCAAGVSLIQDNCGCCKVCARQLFEDCSATQPCDHTKGLECNFGGGFSSAKGICRAKSDGRTCEYNKKIYQNGEIFRLNCKHQCTCMDGAVGCVSLCPHELLLPKVGCARPRRVKIPGWCCERLVCPEETEPEISAGKRHKKNHNTYRPSEDDLINNELTPVWKGASEPLAAFRSQPMGHMVARGGKCVSQTTAWSPCSKSCGPGVSSRVSNSNVQCKLMNETRVCEVRRCSQATSVRMKIGQRCSRIEKTRRPVKLSHAGCHSIKKFQPRYCGTCSDGRCCRPHRTQTVAVRFRCKTGETFSRMVMMIESCRCNFSCSGSNRKTPARHRALNDIH